MALDLKAIAALAASIGMTTAANTRKTCTLKLGYAGSGQALNATTDVMTPDAAGVTVANVLALKYAKKAQQAPQVRLSDGTQASYSHTYAIEAADVPTGREIGEQDIILEGGTNWIVIQAAIDPGDALWIVDVKR